MDTDGRTHTGEMGLSPTVGQSRLWVAGCTLPSRPQCSTSAMPWQCRGPTGSGSGGVAEKGLAILGGMASLIMRIVYPSCKVEQVIAGHGRARVGNGPSMARHFKCNARCFGRAGRGPDLDPSSTRVHRARPVDLEFVARGVLKSFVSAPHTLTSIVQLMAVNQRSQASSTGDTTAPPKEKATTVSFHHFMSMQPPVFTGDGSPDKAEEWIEEIERIFEVLEVPGGNKVKFGSYMLKGDAKRWWKSTREIQFADQQTISWRQFRDSFFSTYFPIQARNKKMREFLDLQQNYLSLEEYITKYRHLEAYCPHLYTTAEAKADKFVYGLRDGLRGRVMSGSPHNLDEAVTMARHMEEDWVRTQRDHQRKTSQHTQGGRMPVKHQHPTGRARPYERRDDRTFRRNRPGRSETTHGSVASPTSPRCPTCSRAHPGKPCYWVTVACLHCGDKRPVGCGYVIGRRLLLDLPLVSPVRSAGGARPQGTVVCCAWRVDSLLPNLGVLGKAEYLFLEFTHPWMSALPLQRVKWIHTVMGHHRGCRLSSNGDITLSQVGLNKSRVEPELGQLDSCFGQLQLELGSNSSRALQW
ncbi:hypothetical protein EJ110_NYTH10424 [Nymphaea thermarum]|nr:hypothetical protein EJ110_NYTH10424 [Nymphaea thermarum]